MKGFKPPGNPFKKKTDVMETPDSIGLVKTIGNVGQSAERDEKRKNRWRREKTKSEKRRSSSGTKTYWRSEGLGTSSIKPPFVLLKGI